MNYLFLIPLYNEWQSVNLLIKKINLVALKKSRKVEVIILNDASTNKIKISKLGTPNIKSIKIINLKNNVGSQRSISIGLAYLRNYSKRTIITIMDSDGEDDVYKVNEMINHAIKYPNSIITSNRTKRREILIFRILYKFHLIFTYLLTAKWISFGNFTSFNKVNIKKLRKGNSICYAYSASVIKNCTTKSLYAERKKRFYGKSKVSFLGLFIHSLKIISVFSLRVFLFSIFYSLVFYKLYTTFQFKILLVVPLLLFALNILILILKINCNYKVDTKLKYFIKNITRIK